MKKIILSVIMAFPFLVMALIPVSGQDTGQKKMHMVIEENGKVVTDTILVFNKDASEEEIQAAVTSITGMPDHPCMGHSHKEGPGDTAVYKCRKVQKSELDSLLKVHGKPCAHMHSDTCRHVEVMVKTGDKEGADREPCKHMEKEIVRVKETGDREVVVIEENGDIIIKQGKMPGEKCVKVIVESDNDTLKGEKVKQIRVIEVGGEGKDCIGTGRQMEKKVIIKEVDGGEEKFIILESPDVQEEKSVEKKITITVEGDKAEKAIIEESPAKSEKKAKKEK